MAMPAHADIDLALAEWRERLAAAGRNITELSELPDFLAVKAAVAQGRATGRRAAEARRLAATMDELWRGVLLLGHALDRVEAARSCTFRRWRGDPVAAAAILNGRSITIALAETPVLHRRLLGGRRDEVQVSPGSLLTAMQSGFDSAREILAGIASGGTTRTGAAAPRRCHEAGVAQAASQALRDARAALADVGVLEDCAAEARAAYRDTIAGATLPAARNPDLAGWLDRLRRIHDGGKLVAFTDGLRRWQAALQRLQAGCAEVIATAGKAAARRDELRGRFGALQAKHRARMVAGGAGDPRLDAQAAGVRAALFGGPTVLPEAGRALAAYEAALARLDRP